MSGKVLYLYRLDFVSNFNEFAELSWTAITASSIEHRVMLRRDAPRVRLPPTQAGCTTHSLCTVREVSVRRQLSVRPGRRIRRVCTGTLVPCEQTVRVSWKGNERP